MLAAQLTAPNILGVLMIQNKRKWLLFLMLFAVAVLAFLPRALEPDAHWSGDETRWLTKSFRFLNGLYKRDPALTNQSYHPGVITMWIGSTSLWSKYGPVMFMVDANSDSSTPSGGITEDQLAIPTPENLARTRIGMAIFNTLIICAIFVALQRLFGFAIAAISILLICYDPTILAESRKLHVDAPLIGLMLLSVMLMLSYFESSRRRLFLILSGIAFGAACLAKVTGFILLAYFPLIAIFYRFASTHDKNLYRLRQFPYILSSFLIWTSSALIAVLTIWPAMWQSSNQLLGIKFPFAILSLPIAAAVLLLNFRYLSQGNEPSDAPRHIKGFAVQLTVLVVLGIVFLLSDQAQYIIYQVKTALTKSHGFSQAYLGEVVRDPGIFYYLVMITIYGTPLTLISSCVGIVWASLKFKFSLHSKNLRALFALAIFVGLYTSYMSMAAKKLSRYILPVYPALAVITAITLIVLVLPWIRKIVQQLASKRDKPHKLSPALATFVILIAIGWQIISVLPLHPNYLAYISPLWRWSDITAMTTIGRGVGIKEAAQYLNELDDADIITVRASYICQYWLPHYFAGEVADIASTPSSQAKYDVLYVQDIQLGSVNPTLYENREPVKSIRVNGVDYVMIYEL